MSTATMTEHVWISSAEACRILGVDNPTFQRIINTGCVTVQAYPSVRRSFLKADVERLARQAIRPANPTEPPKLGRPFRVKAAQNPS